MFQWTEKCFKHSIIISYERSLRLFYLSIVEINIQNNYSPAKSSVSASCRLAIVRHASFRWQLCSSSSYEIPPLHWRTSCTAILPKQATTQMITTMRGRVAHNDLWPWPISSRSFGLDLENRVRSVAFTVLDGFFLYLAQMITIIRGCVACNVFFRIWKFEFLANFKKISALTLKKKIYSSWWILSIFDTNDH